MIKFTNDEKEEYFKKLERIAKSKKIDHLEIIESELVTDIKKAISKDRQKSLVEKNTPKPTVVSKPTKNNIQCKQPKKSKTVEKIKQVREKYFPIVERKVNYPKNRAKPTSRRITEKILPNFQFCETCQKTKNSSEFDINDLNPNGLEFSCINCTNITKNILNGLGKPYIEPEDVDISFCETVYEKIQKDKKALNRRIRSSLSSRLITALRNNQKSGHTLELLGCTIEEFREYLESMFDENMSWDNYGSYWHIDHIIPCARFDLSKPSHQRKCFHYTNMQPLEVMQNLKKSDFLSNGLRARKVVNLV